MTQTAIDESISAARAAIETILYGWQDTLDPISERIQSSTHENLDSIGSAIGEPLTRILSAVDVTLPGEVESHPDWQPLDSLQAQINASLGAAESSVASIADRIIAETSGQVDAIVTNPLDIIGRIASALTDFLAGILGSTVEVPDLWKELYTVLKDNFATDRDPLTTATADIGGAIAHKLGEILSQSLNGYSIIGQGLNPVHAPAALNPDRIAATMDSWPDWVKTITDIVLEGVAAWGILSALAAPKVSEVRQGANEIQPIEPLSPSLAASAVRRGFVGEEFGKAEAKRSGVSPQLFDIILKMSQSFLTADNYIQMWQRTGDDSQLDRLHTLGLDDDDIARLRTLALALPTPSDLVRFMVRDVFDPGAIATGMLDDEFDQKVNDDWNRRVGIDKESLKLFWMAHWQLPSPTMFYEMFHRGYITQDQMTNALKLADYAPGWIDNLVKINYNVPGRIDVRRMWESGVITTREELVKRHRDMGYSPEDSETLATFVERLTAKSRAAETERLHAPIAQEIIRSYAQGGMPYDTALNDLLALGYPDDVARFRLQLGIFQRERDRSERIKQAIHREFVQGFMGEEAVRSALGHYGFEDNEQDALLESWRLDRELRDLTEQKHHERDLSKSEIVSAYADRILSRGEASGDLVTLGYDGSEAETILRLEDSRLQKADNKAAESAIQREYITRRITAQDAQNALAGFGYTDQRIAALMTRWSVEREERRPDLSAAQVERMLMQGVIPEDRAESLLIERGYSDDHVTLLMTLYGSDMAVATEQIDEKRREFDLREQRLREQGGRRLDLTERGQNLAQQRFTTSQTGLQQRFESTQTQQRELQTQRLEANTSAQNARIAAQTARDATIFINRAATQERQIQAAHDRLAANIESQNARAEAANNLRATLASQQTATRLQLSAAADDRQRVQIQAAHDRLQDQINAADARAQDAANTRAELQARQQDHQNELTNLRADLQKARDIRTNAERIASESRQEQARIRTETRASARRTIDTSAAAANAAELQALQFQQTAAVADITSRFATLTAQIADRRRQDALALREAAQASLTASIPASSLLDTNV